jgi:hypothetical protein
MSCRRRHARRYPWLEVRLGTLARHSRTAGIRAERLRALGVSRLRPLVHPRGRRALTRPRGAAWLRRRFHGALLAHWLANDGSYPRETATTIAPQDPVFVVVVCCNLLNRRDLRSFGFGHAGSIPAPGTNPRAPPAWCRAQCAPFCHSGVADPGAVGNFPGSQGPGLVARAMLASRHFSQDGPLAGR